MPADMRYSLEIIEKDEEETSTRLSHDHEEGLWSTIPLSVGATSEVLLMLTKSP